MKRSRIFALLLALAAVVLVAPASQADPSPDDPLQDVPAALQAQTVEFTSPESDLVYGHDSSYFASAVASSGLPVTISTDPASTACPAMSAEQAGPFLIIPISHPGVCIVHADQAGNEQYAAAERVTITLDVAKEPVVLTASKANKGFAGLTPSTFRAELKHEVPFGPGTILTGYVGEKITFWVDGKAVCPATTVFQSTGGFDTTAVATCKATIGLPAALSSSTYNATYSGNEYSQGAVATARLWL